MIWGFSDVSLSTKTNYFDLWSPQDTSNNSRKIPNHLKQYYFGKSQKMEINKFENVGRGGRNPDDPSNKFFRILDMGSISFKNMKW